MDEPGCRYQCRIFGHGDEVVTHRWNSEAQCLWQNNTPHRLTRRHTQCDCRFALTSTYGSKTSTECFAHVCTIVQPKREHTCPQTRENNSQLRQGKKEEHDLQIERCSPNERDIERA